MGLKETTVSVALIGIIMVAILTFIISYQTANGSGPTILDEAGFSEFNTNLTDGLTGFRGSIANTTSDFYSAEPVVGGGDDGFGLTNIFGVVKNFVSLTFATINVIGSLLSEVLGINLIVLNVLGGAMILTLALLVWRVVKAGGT